MSSLVEVSLQDIEDIVDEFHDLSEETGQDRFLDTTQSTADYFGAWGDVEIHSYKQLIRFVQQNATRNPLTETLHQDSTIGDFYAHLEGLRRAFRRNNP